MQQLALGKVRSGKVLQRAESITVVNGKNFSFSSPDHIPLLNKLPLDSPFLHYLNPIQPIRWRSRVNRYTADGQPEIIWRPKKLWLVPSRKADSIILHSRWGPSGTRLANSATFHCPLGICWPSSSPARWADTKYLSTGRELQLWAHRELVLVRGWSGRPHDHNVIISQERPICVILLSCDRVGESA